MNAHSRRAFNITLYPLGGMSAYRTYAQQVYLYARSRPGWAARPGSSNHGWGRAVDLRTRAMRAVTDKIGRLYGWSKTLNRDAYWEWWHIPYTPGYWRGKILAKARRTYPTIRKDQANTKRRRQAVRLAERLLSRAGYDLPATDGTHYYRSLRAAVRRFQRKNALRVDGAIGPRTWTRLLRQRPDRRK